MMRGWLFILVLLAASLAQETPSRSLRSGLSESKALLEMSAPNPVVISGFKESYSYRLTLNDVFFDTKGSSIFGLVMASRAGNITDTISFSFSGPYNTLQPAIANAFHLLMWSGLCLGVPKDLMPTLNQSNEFFGLLVQALQKRAVITLNRSYNGVNYGLGNMDFANNSARFTVVLQNLAQPGQNGWNEYCVAKDLG